MAKDKRYLIFGLNDYYPSGAMSDKIGSIDDLSEYKNFIDTYYKMVDGKKISYPYEYYSIYDRIEGESINTDTLKPYQD